MADEPNLLPLSRMVRWLALASVIVLALALYFQTGRHLPPLGAGDSTIAPASPPAQPAR